MSIVYVDNNATTKVAPEVIDAMLPFLNNYWGNPSSIHTFGGQVAKHIDEARGSIATILGASSPSEIIFTSCGTESDNAAIRSALAASPEKRHIITSSVEHPAVLNLVKKLERDGYGASYLKVDAD
ncbi:MAG TPA: aminotransferase class V-fold PLP-dependent enzyme, partial [bacterium]|nr:aminotransferase class V-fold PLP-dependent enzyme [bacterium]